MPRRIKGFGYIPDLPDFRDQCFTDKIGRVKALPSSVDLRDKSPEVYDQGELGSCTGNAIAAAIQFDQIKQGVATQFTPSRLFIYYNERVIEGTVESDSGAMIRDGIKSVNEQGAPAESLWPYNISKFTQRPSDQVFEEALNHQALEYGRVGQTNTSFKKVLAAGYYVIFGFSVYSAFDDIGSGSKALLNLPKQNEALEGGHAVAMVGYQMMGKKLYYIVRNSWAADWGDKGYFYMAANYATNPDLADDFWSIRLIEG